MVTTASFTAARVIPLISVGNPHPPANWKTIMCLGIPGKILDVYRQDSMPMGQVEFGGITKEICLAYTPDAEVGDFVLVHVGFAISKVDETEAQQIFSYIEEIGELDELEQTENTP